jgi:hypothetical protein
MDKRGTIRWSIVIALSALILIGVSIGGGYIIGINSILNDYTIGSTPVGNECNDDDSCTNDYVLGDGSCVHRRLKTGSDCSKNDICYGNATNKQCCDNGKCVSSRRNCIGICPTNGFQINVASNCTFALFPLNYGQFDNYFLSCVYGACTLTTYQQTAEKRAVDDAYLFNISSCRKNENYAKSKCIARYCSSFNTVCIFRYICASYNFTNNLMDSVLETTTSPSSSNDTNATYSYLIDFPTFGDQMSKSEYTLINNAFNQALDRALKQERHV